MMDTQIRIVCVGKLSPNGNQVKIVPELVWTGEETADLGLRTAGQRNALSASKVHSPQSAVRSLTDAECAAEADDLEDYLDDVEFWQRGEW